MCIIIFRNFLGVTFPRKSGELKLVKRLPHYRSTRILIPRTKGAGLGGQWPAC